MTWKNKRKVFSKSLYKKYDQSGKEFAKDILQELDKRKVEIPKENYGSDLILKHPTIRSLNRHYEVQTTAAWKDTDFPFEALHLPKAKVDRLMKMYGNKLYFMILNSEGNRALVVKASKYIKMKIVSKKNKYSRLVAELFYEIDLELCEYYFI